MYKLLLFAIIIAFTVIISLFATLHKIREQVMSENETQKIAIENCKPTFADGGGPYYEPNTPLRSKIVPDATEGSPLIISGTIYKNDCKTPIKGAVLDIWQADETGNYQDEWYRGRVISDDLGNYMFETVIPKGYGEGTAFRPPHIHFKVWLGEYEAITSQMFFPESKGRPGFDDAYIMNLDEFSENGVKKYRGVHPIILP